MTWEIEDGQFIRWKINQNSQLKTKRSRNGRNRERWRTGIVLECVLLNYYFLLNRYGEWFIRQFMHYARVLKAAGMWTKKTWIVNTYCAITALTRFEAWKDSQICLRWCRLNCLRWNCNMGWTHDDFKLEEERFEVHYRATENEEICAYYQQRHEQRKKSYRKRSCPKFTLISEFWANSYYLYYWFAFNRDGNAHAAAYTEATRFYRRVKREHDQRDQHARSTDWWPSAIAPTNGFTFSSVGFTWWPAMLCAMNDHSVQRH